MNPEEKNANALPDEPDGREDDVEEFPGVGHEREDPERPGDVADAAGSEGSRLKSILEAIIFVSEQPVSLDRMSAVLPDCPKKKLKEILEELEREYEEREGALEIVQVANGYAFRTRAEFAPWLGRLRQQKFARLSRAALETLAIVAYRQPVTRAEAEQIRGVDSGAVLGTLLERRLLRILGRKEVAGRPILYGTTQEFLELFGLNSLKDLPTLREIKDMVETGDEGQEGSDQDRAEIEVVGDEAAAPGDSGSQGEEEQRQEEYEEDDEGEYVGDEEVWSDDEEPLGEDGITTGELDEILKSTRTRLELYEADAEEEEAPEEDEGSDPKESEEPHEG